MLATKNLWISRICIVFLLTNGAYELLLGSAKGLLTLGAAICLLPDQLGITDKSRLFSYELAFASLGILLMLLSIFTPAFIKALLPT